MFPLDVQGTLVQSAVAWIDGLLALLVGIGHALKENWKQFGVMILVYTALVAGFVGVLIWLDHRREKRKDKPAQKEKSLFKCVVMVIAAPLIIFGASMATIYATIICLSLVIAGLILPFAQVGHSEARKEIKNDFKEMALVTVHSPKGDVTRREIGCGPQFCALWGEGHASFAPVSAITWGDAPPPDKSDK